MAGPSDITDMFLMDTGIPPAEAVTPAQPAESNLMDNLMDIFSGTPTYAPAPVGQGSVATNVIDDIFGGGSSQPPPISS